MANSHILCLHKNVTLFTSWFFGLHGESHHSNIYKSMFHIIVLIGFIDINFAYK